MREAVMDLDHQGILPLNGENEGKFYDRGKRFLDAAQELKSKSDGLLDINEELEEFEQRFKTKPAWVSCKYKRLPLESGGQMVRIKHNGFSIPACEIQKPGEALPKPLKDFFEEIEKSDIEPLKGLRDFLYHSFFSKNKEHEMIHCVRHQFLDHPDECLRSLIPWRMFKNPTEEAVTYFLNGQLYPSNKKLKRALIRASLYCAPVFAYSVFEPLALVPALFMTCLPLKVAYSMANTKSTHKALGDIGKKTDPELHPPMRYALLRMKPREIRGLRDYFAENGYSEKAFKEYIEERRNGDLRFDIMMERLC